jgi:hypothetical protein
LVLAVELFEQDLEGVLAAALLQVLEATHRRLGLILDRITNELLQCGQYS